MSIQIGDNFKYLGIKFLDGRESFNTLNDMKNCDDVPNGFITICYENGKRYEYDSSNEEDNILGKWKEYIVNSKSSGGYYIGEEPPTDTSLIWYNTSGNIISDEESSIIKELTAIIKNLNVKISDLEARIEYLEINGGGGGTPEIPPTVEGNCLLLENGNYILLEDGSKLLLESIINIDNTQYILTENGNKLLLEDGRGIIKEG